MIDQHLHDVEIAEIIIVASGCTDNTVPIIQSYLDKDPRLKLIVQPERRGRRRPSTCSCKSHPGHPRARRAAIPCPWNAVENLVRVFFDPTVGMTAPTRSLSMRRTLRRPVRPLRLRMERELVRHPAARRDRSPSAGC